MAFVVDPWQWQSYKLTSSFPTTTTMMTMATSIVTTTMNMMTYPLDSEGSVAEARSQKGIVGIAHVIGTLAALIVLEAAGGLVAG